MTSHVQVANRALARIGGRPIVSFDITSERVQNIKSVYDQVVEDVFSKGRFHCSYRTTSLTKITGTPERKWANKFAFPADRIGLPIAYWDSKDWKRPLTLFELSDNEMWTDAAEVWAKYQVIPLPVNWPGYVREVVVLALMAEYALSVREDQTLRTRLRRDCYGDEQYQGEGGQFGVALMLDAQARPQDQIDGGHSPLISARYSPGDARHGMTGFGFT